MSRIKRSDLGRRGLLPRPAELLAYGLHLGCVIRDFPGNCNSNESAESDSTQAPRSPCKNISVWG